MFAIMLELKHQAVQVQVIRTNIVHILQLTIILLQVLATGQISHLHGYQGILTEIPRTCVRTRTVIML